MLQEINLRSLFKPVKSIVPSHITWTAGGRFYTNPVLRPSDDFAYKLWPSGEPVLSLDVKSSIEWACQKLDIRRSGQSIALAFAGGIDSQLIALNLKKLSIPFELYFLDIWGLNQSEFERQAMPFAKTHGLKLHKISLDRDFFYEQQSLRLFEAFGLEQPTYLALSYLFEKIPRDQFIVVGDGDFHRSGPLFEFIASKYRKPDSSLVLPFSCQSVYFYLWAHHENRNGEFYFFSSTPELISAMLNHPKFIYQYPFSSTREVIWHEFPDIPKLGKTTNWDSPQGIKESRWIRSWLSSYSKTSKCLNGWIPAKGALVDLSHFIRN